MFTSDDILATDSEVAGLDCMCFLAVLGENQVMNAGDRQLEGHDGCLGGECKDQ